MSEDQFTNTREYQIKLLSYMLANPNFCDLAGDVLTGEEFSDKALQWFFDTLAKAKIKLTPATLKETLIGAAKAKQIRADQIEKYVEYFDLLKVKPLPVEEEHISEELGKFIKRQAVKRAITDAWSLAKNEQWDDIVDLVTEAVTKGAQSLESGYFYFEKTQDRLATRVSATTEERLSTGIPGLDQILYGGLKPKQLGLVAGGTGRGKSIFLEWLAQVAILLGKKVVYYTLELPEDEVANRFDALFSQIKINELKTYNNDVFSKLVPMASKFGGSLVIKEYPADTATIHTLKAHLRQLSSLGFVPDLIIVDYLDLLKPHRTYNSQYEEIDAITKALHGFAKESRTRIWTATQLNRSGLTMETPDESSVAGAISKLFTADVAMFLAATNAEREDQEIRIIVAKNRNGPAPRTVKIDTDFARMTFYKQPPTPTTAATTQDVVDEGTEVQDLTETITTEDDVLVLI